LTIAIYLLVLMAAQLSIRQRYLILTGAAAYGLLVILFLGSPGVPGTVWLDTLLLLAAAVLIGTRISSRHVKLLEAVAAEHRQVLAANEDLERKVAERTADVQGAMRELRAAQAQIIHAEKMASVGRLAAGIAHEINNPINFIANSIGPLEGAFNGVRAVATASSCGNGGAEARRERIAASLAEADAIFGTLRRGIERTRAIVSGLNAFARRDESEPLQEEDVGGLVDEAVALMRYELEHRIEVVRRYCSEGRLRCYRGALVQLFVNLLSNAAQAIEGPGTITVTTVRDAGALTISISDSGPGIRPDVLPKIFEPFFTTRDVGRGTGLGLSIAHGIVERHRGQIRVESSAASGTRFDITLPSRAEK
jgi:signal transduction histidine kinase